MEHMVITIARSYGSGGRTLGKKLAKEYGIKSYDNEIIRMASDESGISEGLFGEADEYMRRIPIFKKTAGEDSDGEVFPPDSDRFTSPENLFRYQAKIIRRLAEEESCIIIGRCADYILRDYENVVKLFFYASEANCITRVVAQQGVGEMEAIDRIEKIDRYRANYCKYFTGRSWNDVHNYDFCIDTASMDYDRLIRVVKAYLAER